MKIKKQVMEMILLGTMFMTGCGASKIEDLPEEAVPIEVGTFSKSIASQTEYVSIQYNNREYVPYGMQKGRIEEEMIKECFGHDVQDTNGRYYSLADTDDYIASYNIYAEMDQFSFYRAVDTMGKEIYTPDYVDSLGYDIWEE